MRIRVSVTRSPDMPGVTTHTYMVSFPTRSETLEQLQGLASGALSPLQVENWAEPFVINDATHPVDTDEAVWQALLLLSGANLLVEPSKLLHSHEDFASWLAGFRAAIHD